jgi:hypothetical protein
MEIGNKQSYMGIYHGEALFADAQFPLTLQKMCIAVSYYDDVDHLPSEVIFSVYLPGESEDEPTERTVAIRLGDPNFPKPTPDAKFMFLCPQFVLCPLMIKEEGRIKVRVRRDGETIKLGTLLIKSVPSQGTEEGSPSPKPLDSSD